MPAREGICAGLRSERKRIAVQVEYVEHLGRTDIRMFVVSVLKRQTHFHSDIEIITLIEGNVIIALGQRRYLLEAGDFFFINRNEAHSLQSTDCPNQLLVLQFSPNFAREYCPKFTQIYILQRHIVSRWMPKLHDELRSCFSYMLRCICTDQKREGYPLALMGTLNILAAAILRYGVYEDHAPIQSRAESRGDTRLSNILDYIQENYTHNVSLAELARQQNLDMTHLSHFIKNKLGISFREYVNRLRLERALQLVTQTSMQVLDICAECGYSDYRYLNKAFSQEFGMTPMQLRANSGKFATRFSAPSPKIIPDQGDKQSFLNLVNLYERALSRLDDSHVDVSHPFQNPFYGKSTK